MSVHYHNLLTDFDKFIKGVFMFISSRFKLGCPSGSPILVTSASLLYDQLPDIGPHSPVYLSAPVSLPQCVPVSLSGFAVPATGLSEKDLCHVPLTISFSV